MNVSMDGLRRSLTHDFNSLVDVIKNEEIKTIEIWRKLDDLARIIGGLNCVYDGDGDEKFTDLSGLHIAIVDDDENIWDELDNE